MRQREVADDQAEQPRPAPAPEPEPTGYEPPPQSDAFLNPEAEQLLAAESRARLQQPDGYEDAPTPTPSAARTPEEKRHQQMWAIAMAKESSEITASLPNLPPAERADATMRAALLSSTAHDLTNGTPATPLKPGAIASLTPPRPNGKQPPF